MSWTRGYNKRTKALPPKTSKYHKPKFDEFHDGFVYQEWVGGKWTTKVFRLASASRVILSAKLKQNYIRVRRVDTQILKKYGFGFELARPDIIDDEKTTWVFHNKRRGIQISTDDFKTFRVCDRFSKDVLWDRLKDIKIKNENELVDYLNLIVKGTKYKVKI